MKYSIRTALIALLGALSFSAQAQTCGPVEVLTDPAGDFDSDLASLPAGLPDHDILGLSVSQAGTGEEATLTFSLKTAGFSAPVLPPNAAWFVSFENAEGNVYGVRMQSDPAGAPTYFSYKVAPSNGGQTDGRFTEAEKPAISGDYTADGTITITIKAASVGMEGGGGLGPFNAASVQSVPEGLLALIVDPMPAGLGRDGYFDGCDKAMVADKSSAMVVTGALPAVSLFVLALAGLARRRFA